MAWPDVAAPAAARREASRRGRERLSECGYFRRFSTAAQSTFLKNASTYLPRSKAL